jgi:hypothetical protein
MWNDVRQSEPFYYKNFRAQVSFRTTLHHVIIAKTIAIFGAAFTHLCTNAARLTVEVRHSQHRGHLAYRFQAIFLL